MRILPPQDSKLWKQLNIGKIFGSIWSSWNVDLDCDRGKVCISRRLIRIFDNVDDTDFDTALQLLRTDADGTDRWWAVAEDALFKSSNSAGTSGWAQDAISGSPTGQLNIYSDGIEHEGSLIVSTATDLWKLTSGTWTSNYWTSTLGQTAFTNNVPHPLSVGFDNRLLIGDDRYVHTVDPSGFVNYRRLTLREDLRIIWIVSGDDRYYIGASHVKSGEGVVATWDGRSKVVNKYYDIRATNCYAGLVDQNILYVVNGIGELLAFTGSGFRPVAQFPVAEQETIVPASWEDNFSTDRNVHKNGMAVINGKIHILLSAGTNNSDVTIPTNMHSGIWVFDPENGLYHKISVSEYDGGTVNDYGCPVVNEVGALANIKDDGSGQLLASASIYTDNATTILDALYSLTDDDKLKRGYIVTPQLHANSIQDTWSSIWLLFPKFRSSSDKIIVKYRTEEDANLPARITPVTWTDSDTFTSTDADLANVSAGDEVEVIVGDGQGGIAHVSSISESAGTYTVNLDESITGAAAAGTCQIRIDNWTKAKTITQQTFPYEKVAVIAKPSRWIQFKIELRGVGEEVELEELQIVNTPHLSAS